MSPQRIFVAYLFDNLATVFFAVFMSLSATVYLKMQKRYSARIIDGISNFDSCDEYPISEYLIQLEKAKKVPHLITKMYEPFWRTKFALLASVLGVIIPLDIFFFYYSSIF